MKEINHKSLDELEKLYAALLEGQEDPEGLLSSVMEKELKRYLHPVEGPCSLDAFLRALTPFQKDGLLEEFEGLEEGLFEDDSFLEGVKERILKKEQLFLRLSHVDEKGRKEFAALVHASSASSEVTHDQLETLLIFMKTGLVCCYRDGNKFQSFIPQEVKEAYHTLSQIELEEKSKQVQYWYDFCRAAVNLYGIIPLEALACMYTQYHEEVTEASQVKKDLEHTLLEYIPTLLEIELYGQFVLAEQFALDGEGRRDLLRDQEKKPRYIPESLKEFLRYKEETYVRPYVEQKDLEAFFKKISSQEEENLEELMLRISFEMKFSMPIENTLRSIGDMGFMPKTKELQEEMIDLLIPMENFARKWEHKGYSNNDLQQMVSGLLPNLPNHRPMLTPQGTSPTKNGPCPCGSGKKYKRCCMN